MLRIPMLLVLTFSCLIGLIHGQAPVENPTEFLKRSLISICPGDSLAKSDWHELAPLLKDKRIVLIGEFNHGSREIFLLRNELIRYLHEKLGFNVVLFESGIGELALPNLQMDNMSPKQMTYGFFGGWRTPEFRELMEYIRSEKMAVAGFDVQRTGGSFRQLLQETAETAGMDSTFYYNLEDRYGKIARRLTARGAAYDSVRQETEALMADYRKVHAGLAHPGNASLTTAQALVERTLLNRIAFLTYMLQFGRDRNWSKRWAARDSAMAGNVVWLNDRFWKQDKLIIVGHNYHIAKFSEHERVMGQILLERFRDEMYSIGTFAGRGAYADNSGKTEQMTPPDSTGRDIKHLIGQMAGFAGFLDMPDKAEPGSDWLNGKITVNDTFIDLSGSHEMVLSRHFDGLLLLKTVSPPEKN